ncbi:hypothetical protein PTTG_07827 [Puccinia triticina 1-1 BBBD Race 1]|uniref:Uncharacterized protein n=1 Tax=Puccinia triticina (isolate 1-1 / race 1 (BBBD)) TaxID=630390 RepID=A0A180GFJ5_PUCT1|nr:hypothetical protein PTTG_07827 [Puccinia triticina 1-1 BBBD Race 1]WAR62626.1 hypothetical protein PtB15_15B213 [Puccinia triticina]
MLRPTTTTGAIRVLGRRALAQSATPTTPPPPTRLLLASRPSPELRRPINTSSTAYPSGSVKHPTQIIPPSSSPDPPIRSEKSRTVPDSHRELPDLPSRTPLYVGSFLVIASVWAGFIYFSTNAEKANSSIVKAVLFELRSNPSVLSALGHSIKPQKDDLFGQLLVDGSINLMQGSVDVAFRVTGSERSGKVYFTSVRRERGSEFEIIRWKLIRDDGVVVDLVNQDTHVRPVLLSGTDTDIVTIGAFNRAGQASGTASVGSTDSHCIRLV